jgi:hypothetical protein
VAAARSLSAAETAAVTDVSQRVEPEEAPGRTARKYKARRPVSTDPPQTCGWLVGSFHAINGDAR